MSESRAPLLFRPLRHEIFRRLWTMNVFSNVGTWMQNAAAAWVMAMLTPSPLWLGLIQTAATLPIFLFAIPGGIFADLHNRRKVLLVTQGAMALTALAFALCTWSGGMSPGVLLALTFVLGTGNAINTPAWHGTVSNLVAPEEVTAAVSLHNLSLNIGRAIGPALAGLVLAQLGAGTAFFLNSISFIGVLAVLYAWRSSETPARGQLGAEVRETFRETLRNAPFRWLLLQSGVYFALAIPLWSFLPAISRDTFHSDAGGFGLLMTCLGVGAALAASVFGRLLQSLSPGQLLARAVLCYALSEALVLLVPSFAIACLVLLLAGASWFVVSSLLVAGAQVPFPPRLRSRATAFVLVILYGGQALGSSLGGALAPRFGVRAVVVGAAVMMALLAFARLFSQSTLPTHRPTALEIEEPI